MPAYEAKTRKSDKSGHAGRASRSASGGGATFLQSQSMPPYTLGQGVTPGVSLLGGAPQAKLVVGQAGDPYEREADSVAERVTSGQTISAISSISPGDKHKMAQRQIEEQEQEQRPEGETLTQPLTLQREAAADEDEKEVEENEGGVAQPLLQKQTVDEPEDEEDTGGLTQPALLQPQPQGEDEEPTEDAVQPLLLQREAVAEEPPPDGEELAQPLLLQRRAADATVNEERGQAQSCGCKGACHCGANAGAAEPSTATGHETAVVQSSSAVVQTSSSDGTGGGAGAESVSQAVRQRGGGEPLHPSVQDAVESHTGFDMSSVRVHQDNSAQNAARSLKARAFTHGSDIWLGPGESPADLRLMSHEATHVVQQNSATSAIQTIQRKPSDYQHSEDGGAVRGRLNERFAEIRDRREEEPAATGQGAAGARAEARRSANTVDRAAMRARSSELRGETRPDVDRPAQEQPRVQQTAAAVERETETPPEPLVEGAAATQPQGQEQAGAAVRGAAEQAAALAQQAFAAANAQTEPAPEIEVQPPEPVMPVDSAGEPLEADPEAEGALASLTARAQFLREQGTLMRSQAAEGRSNAEITRGNLAKVTGEISKAEEGITRSQEHSAYRREVVGQAEQALGVSEEKAATVAAQAPEYTAKADEGREETGPMAGEASGLVAENAANTPEDDDAAADSREQGQKMSQVGQDSTTMDSAVTQTRERAGTLAADAAHAAETNTQTRGTISSSQQQIAQLDARLTQHSEQAGQARAQAQSMASQPADLHARSNQLDEQGRALIASSFELETRLQDVQRSYAEGTAAVPPLQPWEGEVPGEESGAEGTLQMQPDESEQAHADSLTVPVTATPTATPTATTTAAPATTTTTTAPTSTNTSATATPAANTATQPSATTVATPNANVPASIRATGVQPGATEEAQPDATEPAATGEEPAAERETGQPSATGEQSAEAAPEAADTPGATGEAVPELVDLQPREREPIDLNRQLPPWLTGINPESAERHDAAAQDQDEQRRTEIAEINRLAGGRPISQLGAGQRVGIALRMVAGRYYNSVANIKWPGWGGLARALLDPRSMLTGAVGGLNMILNAGASFSERWQQDRLGAVIKTAADIATGLAIVLGSITALAGLVAAVMGALILVSFGFAAPIALPVISVCTTIITTVGGWTIAVGKIALVLQALSLIKNLIDAATAQTADALQHEVGDIQSDINGAAAAGMAIVGAKGAQAGLGRIRSRVAGVIRASRRAGGARALARQVFGRGFAAAGRGTQAVGRGIARGVRAIGRGAAAVGRGARAVGRGVVSGARAVGRGVARGVRGIRSGMRSLRDRLHRRFGRTPPNPSALVGRSRGLRIGNASHTLSIRRIGDRIALWLCSDCGEFLESVKRIRRQLPTSGPVARRIRAIERQAAKLNRRIARGTLTPAEAQAQLDRLANRLEHVAEIFPGERAFGAARLTYGTNFFTKIKKHSQQMRAIARGHGFEIPTSPANPATAQAMRNYIQHVVRNGQTRFGQYMTVPDAIWTKLDNGIVIRRASGEFLTFLDYSLERQALGWDLLPIP